MYAIIETGGKQYWVSQGVKLQVEKLAAQEGSNVEIKALWSGTEGADAAAGKAEAKVTAKVVRHLRGPKVLIFKKKRKVGYEKTKGHRQELTELEITSIK